MAAQSLCLLEVETPLSRTLEKGQCKNKFSGKTEP